MHGRPLGESMGRFCIVDVLARACDYPGFDPDKHSNGAFISWNLLDTESIKRVVIEEEQGTEALIPKVSLNSPAKKRDEGKWIRNIKKRSSNSGKSCTLVCSKGKNKGKEIKCNGKELKASCGEECKLKCSEEFGEEERKKLFDAYWALADINEKRAYLVSRIERCEVKRRMSKEAKKNRQNTFEYWFPDPDPQMYSQGYNIRVCQKMFLNTLGISSLSVATAFKKVDNETGAMQQDKRGKHGNHKKIDKKREQRVIDHIESFKVVESHYVRKTETAQFLPRELSITDMHRMYLEKCEEFGEQGETFDFYKRVFRRKFRLKFMKPKKDDCNTCTTFDAIPEKTKEQEEEHAQHLADKEFARAYKTKQKDEASVNPEVAAAAFDLQQVLLCLFGPTGAFYYSWRLKNFNFTVTELDNMTTHAYLWNEHEGCKVSCEMATCLSNFLGRKAEEGNKKVYLFCDRCGGQNLNRFMQIMLAEAVEKTNLEEIELMYLVPGHSPSENDNAHSVIEGHVKGRKIYTTNQWETQIENALKKNKCITTSMMHVDFIDFKSTKGFGNYPTVHSDKCMEEDGDGKVTWSLLKHVLFKKRDPMMYFKYYYDEDFRCCKFVSKPPKTRVDTTMLSSQDCISQLQALQRPKKPT